MRRINLSDPAKVEKMVWKEILRSPESRYDHRLHGVLSVCRGLSCYESAAVWGRSPRTLEYWVRRFEQKGLDGLMERGRPGRPSRLRKAQLRRLASDVARDPVLCGYPDSEWTGETLRGHLAKEYRVRLGVRQCQRLLTRLQRDSELN